MKEPIRFYEISKKCTHFYGIKKFWNELIAMKLSFCIGWEEEHQLFICLSIDKNYFVLQTYL